jgi:hypothetical protein
MGNRPAPRVHPTARNVISPRSSATQGPEEGRWLPMRIRYACCSLGLGRKRISTRFSNAEAMRRSISKEWPS